MTPAQQVAWDAMRSAYDEATVKRMERAMEPGTLVADHGATLRAALERIEDMRDQNSEHYGSWYGGDPRDFTPDPECSTEEERVLHRAACEAAERDEPGARDLPRGFIAGTLSRDQRFGLGTTTFRDAEGDAMIAALRALAPPETSPTRAEMHEELMRRR